MDGDRTLALSRLRWPVRGPGFHRADPLVLGSVRRYVLCGGATNAGNWSPGGYRRTTGTGRMARTGAWAAATPLRPVDRIIERLGPQHCDGGSAGRGPPR